jgi:hypothetical protein
MKKLLALSLFIILCLKANAQDNEIQKLQLKVDSLQNELDSCQISLMFQSNFPFPLTKIKGKFIEVSHGDCLHILFKDSEGTIWDFGSANNSVPYDLWEFDNKSGEFMISKNVKGKEFILILADLIAIECNSAGSYDEGRHRYIKMPTILEMYEE